MTFLGLHRLEITFKDTGDTLVIDNILGAWMADGMLHVRHTGYDTESVNKDLIAAYKLEGPFQAHMEGCEASTTEGPLPYREWEARQRRAEQGARDSWR